MKLEYSRVIDISLPLSHERYRNNLPKSMVDHFAARPIGFEVDTLITRDSQFSSGQLVRGVKMRLHAGTHVDAPEHWVEGGSQVQDLPLSTFIGATVVVDVKARKGKSISAGDLAQGTSGIDLKGKRVLIRTGWNDNVFVFDTHTWKHESPYLETAALEWLIRQEILLVGIDFYHGASAPHVHEEDKFEFKCARAGILTLTNLFNLTAITKAEVFMIALPLALSGVEAAPVRAVVLE